MKRATLYLGLSLIGLVVLLAVVGIFWTPYSPTAMVGPRLARPGWPHLLGTDGFGADIFSRIINGAKIVLLVGIVSVSGAALVGVPTGIFAGMKRGWAGEIPARLADILYGFPALLHWVVPRGRRCWRSPSPPSQRSCASRAPPPCR